MNEFLIERGIDALDVTGMGKQDLIELFRLVAFYRMTLKELDKRFSLVEVIRHLIENPDLLALDTPALFEEIRLYLDQLGYNILNKHIDDDTIHLYVQTEEGLEEIIINDDLFTNPFYNEARYIFDKISERDLSIFEGRDILELLDEIEKSAKKGAYIQRYKGLGEMNPEQLWETTMNPENRRLLRVTIEDGEAASDVFTLFMGDEVEPRRRYIEEHAKDVKHLDV
jgi:DNA gyrase subunit B